MQVLSLLSLLRSRLLALVVSSLYADRLDLYVSNWVRKCPTVACPFWSWWGKFRFENLAKLGLPTAEGLLGLNAYATYELLEVNLPALLFLNNVLLLDVGEDSFNGY